MLFHVRVPDVICLKCRERDNLDVNFATVIPVDAVAYVQFWCKTCNTAFMVHGIGEQLPEKGVKR
jgi:hypothetical protein